MTTSDSATREGELAYELYISHAEADKEWVERHLLEELGIDRERVLLPAEFTTGRTWLEETERAVATSRHTLLVLTPAHAANPWADLSRRLAAHESIERGQRRRCPQFTP